MNLTKPDVQSNHAIPSSVPAEQAVIGILLGGGDLLDVVSPHLRPEDFYADPHRIIFDTMIRVASSGNLVDMISVQDLLESNRKIDQVGGPNYLLQLASAAPGAGNIKEYVRIVKEKSTRRKVMQAADNIKGAAASASNLGHGASIGIGELFSLLQKDGALKEPATIGKILPAVIDLIDQRGQGVINAIPTGFSDLDTKLLGGLRRGDVIVVAGRPSMGKTTIALQAGQNVAISGQNVMVFTLEMSREQLVERSLAQVGGIEYSRIVSGNLREDDYDRMTYAVGKLIHTPLLIDDTGGLTIQDISARARAQAKISGKLDLIIVDYLQIMSYSGRAQNRNDQLGEISRQMKSLAKELDAAIIVISQLNREVDKRVDKRPIMSDLRESGAIEQDADVIMFIYRDEVYNTGSEFAGLGEVIIRKFRNGSIGTVGLRFEGDKVRFANLGTGWSGGGDE